MSLIHCTLVGHFDPRRVHLRDYSVSRPLDKERLDALLAELPPGAAEHIGQRDGDRVRCQWSPVRGAALSQAIFDFAYRLAREEGCVAVENGHRVSFPPEACAAQREELAKARRS